MSHHKIRITFELEANRKLTSEEIFEAIHNALHFDESMRDFMCHQRDFPHRSSPEKPFTVNYVRVAQKDFVQEPIT